MEFTFEQLLLANIALFVGAIVHGTVGFGLIMVAAPFLALISPSFFPAPAVLVGFLMPLMVTCRHWREVEKGPIGFALIGRVFGTLAAVALLVRISNQSLAFSVGWMVLVSVALSVSGLSLPQTRSAFAGVGLLSGFMGLTSALGGVPIGLSYRNNNPDAYRATVSGFLSIGAAMSVTSLALMGRLDSQTLATSAALVPGVAIGFLTAIPLTKHLRKTPLKPIAQATSAFAAIAVIAKNWP